jgi:hypothetical protein
VQSIGKIVVEAGSAIELGELIELSRDASADWSISADWATQAWVNAQILIGGVPYDVDLTALNPGAGTAGQLYKVASGGLAVEAFTLQLNAWAIGNGVAGGVLYEKADGKIGTRPIPKVITGDITAAPGDTLYVDIDAIGADVAITLPPAWGIADAPVALIVISATYELAHTITVLRNGAQTIMGFADDLQITRRRSMLLHSLGGNNVRFT